MDLRATPASQVSLPSIDLTQRSQDLISKSPPQSQASGDPISRAAEDVAHKELILSTDESTSSIIKSALSLKDASVTQQSAIQITSAIHNTSVARRSDVSVAQGTSVSGHKRTYEEVFGALEDTEEDEEEKNNGENEDETKPKPGSRLRPDTAWTTCKNKAKIGNVSEKSRKRILKKKKNQDALRATKEHFEESKRNDFQGDTVGCLRHHFEGDVSYSRSNAYMAKFAPLDHGIPDKFEVMVLSEDQVRKTTGDDLDFVYPFNVVEQMNTQDIIFVNNWKAKSKVGVAAPPRFFKVTAAKNIVFRRAKNSKKIVKPKTEFISQVTLQTMRNWFIYTRLLEKMERCIEWVKRVNIQVDLKTMPNTTRNAIYQTTKYEVIEMMSHVVVSKSEVGRNRIWLLIR